MQWVKASTMRPIIIALALLLIPAAARAASADRGQLLYDTRCASCHGENGQGSPRAPALIGKSAADVHLMLDTGRMPAASSWEEELHKQPAFGYADIGAIVSYVESFSLHPDTALPVVAGGDVNHGRALFASNCAQCHGAAAQGASTGYRIVAPSLLHASVFQVAEAVRAGPLLMPKFGPDVLSDADVNDIARYVNYLQTNRSGEASVNAGGISLGDVGPVAEGLIGWLVGLGLLMLFVRFIGTTD